MYSLKWKIGEVEIRQIVELEAGEVIQFIIEKATPENIKKIDWLSPCFADNQGHLKALVQSFLIKSNGKNILIDTCNGNNKKRTDFYMWSDLETDFLTRLAYFCGSKENIDIVVCTHLHIDHVGWNTHLKEGIWKPTFSKARHLISRKEYEYLSKVQVNKTIDYYTAFKDSVMPIVKAGLVDFVDDDYKIDNNISLFLSPGHNPYHFCVLVKSKGQKAIISGDFIHHPCQIAEPTWVTKVDSNPDLTIKTRKEILTNIADRGILLIGSHFSNPVAGFIRHYKNNYRFEVLPQEIEK